MGSELVASALFLYEVIIIRKFKIFLNLHQNEYELNKIK